MIRSRKFFVFLLLPFLFTVQDSDQVLPQPLAPLAAPQSGEPLKILTWNVNFLPTVNPFAAVSRRALAVAAAIAAEDPTVVVLQEAFLQRARRQINGLLHLRYPYTIGPINDSPNSLLANSGLYLLSKIPLDSIGSVQFDDCADADCLARKGALMVQGVWQGSPFQLITTHLQAEGYAGIRRKQMQKIETALIAPRRAVDVPLFLCGDFNTDIRDVADYQEMLGCLDAVDARPSSNVQHSYEDSANGKMLLDYVLVRHCEQIDVQSRILPKAYMPEDPKAELSDHLPLLAAVHF